jgi:cytoskeletal protein CcmA (bactofilin family)
MATKRKSARKSSPKKTSRKSSPRKSASKKPASRRKASPKKKSTSPTQPNFTSVSGPFQGKITTPGVLHISSNGSFNATVEAGAVQVDGSFKGKVNAKGDVLITKGAKANGAFSGRCIFIEEGADFDGRCRVSGTKRRAA